MKNLNSLALKVENSKVYLLDQQLLPNTEKWIDASTFDVMIDCIKKLKVRGAPLIGVAAVMCVAAEVQRGLDEKDFISQSLRLREARPTAVNLMISIDKILNTVKKFGYNKELIIKTAEDIFIEDVQLCDSIAKFGNEIIEDGDNILTHCNTGGLATSGVGTALGVIRKAADQGKKIHVFVDETRPLLQGGRLTTYELSKLGIDYTLICDNMAAHLMSKNKIQKVLVGADRIAVNGDFANKIGTYSCAVNSHFHRIPFYVVAPFTTVDKNCFSGDEIPIEQRSKEEVMGAIIGDEQKVIWAPSSSNVYNPAFDVTPSPLITGWITDKGIFNFNDIESGVFR